MERNHPGWGEIPGDPAAKTALLPAAEYAIAKLNDLPPRVVALVVGGNDRAYVLSVALPPDMIHLMPVLEAAVPKYVAELLTTTLTELSGVVN